MLLVRFSLLRRVYVYLLNLMTRIAYQTNLRRRHDTKKGTRINKISRINSELEFGPEVWESSFFEPIPSPRSPPIPSEYSNGHQHVVAPKKNDPGYRLEDMATCVTEGVDAIVGDSLTECFTSEPSEPWNFLTRNLPAGQLRLPPYLMLLWIIGIWIRYFILLPFRLFVIFGGFLSFGILYPLVLILLPNCELQNVLKKWLLRYLASVFVASWSGYIRYHGKRPKRRPNQIYVANHTSLIDLFVLTKDYNFSVIGQRHKGVAGMFQDLLLTAQNHVWFDREQGHERRRVQYLLKQHVESSENEPMLVFPEGTCTNTEYCIMFKKGSFELGAAVYPVALRYRKEFGDAFWNSMQSSFLRHIFDLMTSWSVFCDVYYLEPQTMRPGESASQFASRVQELICKRACLTKVNWNGFLKRRKISPRFLEQRQKAFAAVINRRMNGHVSPSASARALQSLERMEEILKEKMLEAEKESSARSKESSQSSQVRRRKIQSDDDGLYKRHHALVVRAAHRTVRFATDAAQATVRWGIALALLTLITVISVRMTPASWKRIVAEYARTVRIRRLG